MTRTFLLTLDVGSDTDLQGIALEIEDALSTLPYPLADPVRPWSSHSQGGLLPPTPPDVSGLQKP